MSEIKNYYYYYIIIIILNRISYSETYCSQILLIFLKPVILGEVQLGPRYEGQLNPHGGAYPP